MVEVSRRYLGAFMKKVLFAGVAFAAIAAGPAMAADVAIPEPAPAPVYSKPRMMTQFYDWTGFYLGGRVDYSRVRTMSTVTTGAGAVEAALDGSASNFHGGGQVGFDYMMLSRVVIGV